MDSDVDICSGLFLSLMIWYTGNRETGRYDGMGNGAGSSCSSCAYYIYDDEYDEYICDAAMDEDDYVRLRLEPHYSCPYYRNGDEYRIVRKQM